jgi:hypothetical protein
MAEESPRYRRVESKPQYKGDADKVTVETDVDLEGDITKEGT